MRTSLLLEKEDALGCGCVRRANKSAEYTDGAMCTKPVLSAVSITADEKKTRAFGRQTRAVKAKDRAIYGADLFALFAGNKSRVLSERRRAASERKIASTCAR